MTNLHAAALGKRRWAHSSNRERSEHSAMMREAQQENGKGRWDNATDEEKRAHSKLMNAAQRRRKRTRRRNLLRKK